MKSCTERTKNQTKIGRETKKNKIFMDSYFSFEFLIDIFP